MVIDGKGIADKILNNLTESVRTLQKTGVTPTMAVILVGNDPASLSYIKQKQKAADRIGARLILEQFPNTVTPEQLLGAIAHYNTDASVHGLIIQRPVPAFINDTGNILETVSPAKDIDGFIPNSPFSVPVAKAVVTLLEHIHTKLVFAGLSHDNFIEWLTTQQITVVGRGDTAGEPIAKLLIDRYCPVTVVHSKTTNPKRILKQSSVIISCVGKKRIITPSFLSKGVILISVGLSRDKDNTLHGDYEAEEIQNIASFYTPTPGGVGPLNVACLMQNLVDAAIIQTNNR